MVCGDLSSFAVEVSWALSFCDCFPWYSRCVIGSLSAGEGETKKNDDQKFVQHMAGLACEE